MNCSNGQENLFEGIRLTEGGGGAGGQIRYDSLRSFNSQKFSADEGTPSARYGLLGRMVVSV